MSQRFDDLKERLLRAGIAPRHVQRYLRELGDHFDDLVSEETAKDVSRDAAETAARRRLGGDHALAAALLARPELRSFTARYPWAVFCIGSVLTLIATVVLAVLLEVGFLYAHLAFIHSDGGPLTSPPSWLKMSVTAWNWLLTYAAPVIIAAFLCVLGIRQRVSMRWIIFGGAIVCVLGGFHEVGVKWSDIPHRSELYATFVGPHWSRDMIIAGFFHAAANMTLTVGAYWLLLRSKSSAAAE